MGGVVASSWYRPSREPRGVLLPLLEKSLCFTLSCNLHGHLIVDVLGVNFLTITHVFDGADSQVTKPKETIVVASAIFEALLRVSHFVQKPLESLCQRKKAENERASRVGRVDISPYEVG